jgi:putative transposase
MESSPLGRTVEGAWIDAIGSTSHVTPHAFVIMPNHVHFVVLIELGMLSPERHAGGGLAQFVGGFKARATGAARRSGIATPIWQRGFHEAVLEGERQISDAVYYVERNPHNWGHDPYR